MVSGSGCQQKTAERFYHGGETKGGKKHLYPVNTDQGEANNKISFGIDLLIKK